jgi:hypothetical protein
MKWDDTLTPALDEIMDRLDDGDHLVKVGLPDDPKVGDEQKTLGEVARINEFGSSDGVVPERPAWRRGLAHGASDFNRLNQANLALVVQGKKTIEQALGELGAMGAARVKTEILDGDFIENAPSTVVRKGSSHPLIDTAQEKQSITWEIVG